MKGKTAMPKPEEKDEQVVVDDDLDVKKGKEGNDDGVVIPLDDNDDPIPAETLKKQQEEAEKSKEEEKRQKNAEFAQRRLDQEKQKLRQQLEESNRRIAELEKRSGVNSFGQNMATQPVSKDDAYWEKRLAENPTMALREFYKEERQKELKAQSEIEERQKMLDSWQSTLEESKNMAIEEFPSLEQEGSPEYDLFMDILGKHPEWRNSPIGPMKVAKEMKKIMADGKGGNDVISKVRAEAAANERNRQARIVNQPLSNSRPIPSGNKVVLTREQMQTWQDEFKDRGVTLERYAQMVKRSQGEGGVEL